MTCNHLTCIDHSSTCLEAFCIYTSQCLISTTTSKSSISLSGTGAESHARPSPNCAGSHGQPGKQLAAHTPLQASVQLPAGASRSRACPCPSNPTHALDQLFSLADAGNCTSNAKKNALDHSFVGKGFISGTGSEYREAEITTYGQYSHTVCV